jgi:hypothetical protein
MKRCFIIHEEMLHHPPLCHVVCDTIVAWGFDGRREREREREKCKADIPKALPHYH